ncbi:MAG: YbaN family protein [Thermovirgaceae bacterium]
MTFPKPLLVSIGILCVGLGSAGIVLPLVPTTPFLLLAAACFAKSSERFYAWLLGHRRFGPIIANYREKGGITRKTRAVALCLLWFSITLSAFTALSSWPARGVLFAVAAAVTVHLVSLKTVP